MARLRVRLLVIAEDGGEHLDAWYLRQRLLVAAQPLAVGGTPAVPSRITILPLPPSLSNR